MAQRCKACGGIYELLLPDGMQYFHTCSPLPRADVQKAVDAGTIVLRPGETVDDALGRRSFERPNKRDENVTPGADQTKPATMKSAGAGVDQVPALQP